MEPNFRKKANTDINRLKIIICCIIIHLCVLFLMSYAAEIEPNQKPKVIPIMVDDNYWAP